MIRVVGLDHKIRSKTFKRADGVQELLEKDRFTVRELKEKRMEAGWLESHVGFALSWRVGNLPQEEDSSTEH